MTFLDILGFSEIVRKTEKYQFGTHALAEALTEIGSPHPALNESDDFQFQSFSDFIVMSFRGYSDGLTPYFLFYYATLYSLVRS